MKPLITPEEMTAYLGRPLSKVETDNYQLYLNLARIRLEDLICDELTLPLPADLALLLARCFAVISQEQDVVTNLGVTNKKVEDFSVSYDTEGEAPMVALVDQNKSIIDKYSRCTGPIRSGRTWRSNHGYCL